MIIPSSTPLPSGQLQVLTAPTGGPLSQVVNVASVPFRSPFRYAGGKTWLVPRIRTWLLSQRPPVRDLIEPFAGGGIVSLTAGFEGLATHATLAELDPDVAAVWEITLSDQGPQLAAAIMAFTPTPTSVAELFGRAPTDRFDRAFRTIVKNRVNRGGILAPGAGLVKAGENGRGLASRWYPETLAQRLLAIWDRREQFTFVAGCGLSVLADRAADKHAVYFIDPPYTLAGRRLYAHSEINHADLFTRAASLRGDFLMTYDDHPEVRALARQHGFAVAEVAMKNTHHRRQVELLIGRDLRWAARLAHGEAA